MAPDRRPAEPEESDDESEDDAPSNPALDIVDYPLFTPEGGVDSDTFGLFWGTVLIANAAVLALALGPMLIYFRGQWSLGGSLFAVGLVLLAWVHYRVRTHQARTADADGGDDPGA